MAFFMFIDESGQDQRQSPYEVLAGAVIHDSALWPLIRDLHDSEVKHFGCRFSDLGGEMKGQRLLKTKIFRQAASCPPFAPMERARRAEFCLRDGGHATPDDQAALSQAKLAYVSEALQIAARHRCRVFASIVPRGAPRTQTPDVLRKDYSYLFERFFFLLDEESPSERGIVVFDELERSQSHILIGQMKKYFMETATGRKRRARVLPEPFFVHSHLTTGIHVADLVAYIISWGVRQGAMTLPARAELAPYAAATVALAYDMRRGTRTVWALNLITDLSGRTERGIAVTPGRVPRPPRRPRPRRRP